MELRKRLVPLVVLSLVFGATGCASRPSSAQPGAEQAGGDPWIRAARTGDIATMRQMMATGRKVGDANSVGVTALMIASREGNLEFVKWLLAEGADASVVDGDGQSALVYALVGSGRGAKLESLVEVLIKAGANPFLIDRIGFQPLQEMLEQDMDQQIRKLTFTSKKPCDLVPKRPGEISISRMARRLSKVEMAEFLESQGCW